MALDLRQQQGLTTSSDFVARVAAAVDRVAGRTLKPSDGDGPSSEEQVAVAHEALSGAHDLGATRFTSARLAASLDEDEAPSDEQIRAQVTYFLTTLLPSG